jgi:hypothetical protein
MAKVVSKHTDAPAKNDVYVGMLLLTVLATGVGITCLALELNEDYKWESVPKGGPPIAKKEAAPKAETPKDEPKPTPVPEEKDKTQAPPPLPLVDPVKPEAAFAPPPVPVVTPVSATVPELPKPVTPPLALPAAPQ